MLKIPNKAALLATAALLSLPSLPISPVLAEAPSLGNGILCVARGKTDKGTKIYFYTSVIEKMGLKPRPLAIAEGGFIQVSEKQLNR
ncbi:MAG: hypothetical protein EWV85_19760 [Microcystis aeruginosa Ma_QC_C_20070703_M131]|uniref:Uncharacterized protein n=1 Tax=Microcystis aeruginosa Ma_QC_C_20070703_M131 TaxID=2486263 RepID=A0A551X8E6_MICAE|nr:MAG: hypothetical protein EWV85_19760 [Microcystis aeruginosa Ma_QC_C_20070703_M131]